MHLTYKQTIGVRTGSSAGALVPTFLLGDHSIIALFRGCY